MVRSLDDTAFDLVRTAVESGRKGHCSLNREILARLVTEDRAILAAHPELAIDVQGAVDLI